MKILVLGASHGTGALCVKSALAKGHSVTAFSRGTKYCIDAMKEHGVKRLVVLSAHGIGESKPEASWFQRTLLIGGLLKGFFRDHDVQERLTQESGLDFVIARPMRLTNGKAKGTYVRRTTELISVPATISRADVADFMVEACESTALVGKRVQLGG
mgnify:CR=1 FL=1|jgi:uncharacterized protein YbjT (DUF2867 family)